jgi:hypothetical protein
MFQGAGRFVMVTIVIAFTMRLRTEISCIHPAKTADQPRLRADGLRVDFLARLCTA